MVGRGLIWNCCFTNGKTLGSVFQQDLNENGVQRKCYALTQQKSFCSDMRIT